MGSGFKTFEVGEVLGAADVNGYLMKQAVMAFANGAAIIAGITSPEEGMIAYARDLDIYWYYTGSAWSELSVAGAWYDYTPVWTASSSNPSLGNGTASGRYMREGRKITFFAEIAMGSSTTFGSGTYSISLPVDPRTEAPSQHVQCRASDASGGQAWGGQSGLLLEDTGVQIQIQRTNIDNVTPTVPFTWASGDTLRVFGTYEAAA